MNIFSHRFHFKRLTLDASGPFGVVLCVFQSRDDAVFTEWSILSVSAHRYLNV